MKSKEAKWIPFRKAVAARVGSMYPRRRGQACVEGTYKLWVPREGSREGRWTKAVSLKRAMALAKRFLKTPGRFSLLKLSCQKRDGGPRFWDIGRERFWK